MFPAAAFANVEGKSLTPADSDYTLNLNVLQGSELAQVARPVALQADHRLDDRMVQFKFAKLREEPFPEDIFVDAESMVRLLSDARLNEVAKFLHHGNPAVRRQLLTNFDAA